MHTTVQINRQQAQYLRDVLAAATVAQREASLVLTAITTGAVDGPCTFVSVDLLGNLVVQVPDAG